MRSSFFTKVFMKIFKRKNIPYLLFAGLFLAASAAAVLFEIIPETYEEALNYSERKVAYLEQGVLSKYFLSSGDGFEFGSIDDQLESGENIGNVVPVVTEFDLRLLRGGSIDTNAGATQYTQYLRFSNPQGEIAAGRRKSIHEEETDAYKGRLRFEQNTVMFEYQINFDNGLASEIVCGKEVCTADELRKLSDLKEKNINILGENFTFWDGDVNTAEESVRLELFHGIHDLLEEGQTKNYELDEKNVSVHVQILSDDKNEVVLSVNGQKTPNLQEGERTKINNVGDNSENNAENNVENNVELGIVEIFPNEAEEYNGGDLVEFFISTNTLSFFDSNYTDQNFESGLEVNENNIAEALVRIDGGIFEDDRFIVRDIYYRLKARSKHQAEHGDIDIPPEGNLRNELAQPESILSPNWGIFFYDWAKLQYYDFNLTSTAEDEYNIFFTNREGLAFHFPFADNSNDQGLGFHIGDRDDDFTWIEADSNTDFNGSDAIQQNQYFMVNSEPSENGITHVLQYEGVNVPKQELTFTEQYLSPEKINIPFQGTPGVNGRAELVVGGATYDVFIGGENENYSLTIDLNDDSVIGDGQGVNDGVGPNNASLHASPTALNDSARAVLVVHGGGIVDIGNDTPTTTFNMTVTTIASQFEEGGRNAVLGQDEIVRMEIQALPNNKLDLNVYGITFRR